VREGEDPALAALMAAYQSGSVDAFDRLHEALAPDLKAYLTNLARDPSLADDLVQETFLQMHRARAAHTPGEPVRPWVFAIAKRVFLMYRRSMARRMRRERQSAPDATGAPAPEGEVLRLHARHEVETALRHVQPEGRRAFVLHHGLGFSFKEIGARLGITSGAAKIRSSRAATVMRALLRESRDE
jgi:RNA polymerase sigma-70 factor, ECF subfamily